MTSSPILDQKLCRVSRRNPCPICGKRKWCGYAEDGSFAICMEISEGSVKETANGGYIHILKETEPRDFPRLARQAKKPQPIIAPIEQRHRVYTGLLERLTLSGAHGDSLMGRGLSDTTIARDLYASVPRQKTIRKVCADLATHFDLQNVPGFSRQDNKWHLNLTDWHAGFLVPVRDKYGRIQACQIRRDTGQPRYIWLSSAGLSDGASSGAPVHFARPWRVASTGEAIITEGSLKSAVISEHLDACAIGIAGVSSFGDDFGQWLKSQLPQLEHVLIAFDSDWHKNPDVERAMLRLMATIEAAGLAGGLLDWSEAKGLDDLLTREVNA